MVTIGEVFECAMALIDELDEAGASYSEHTLEYNLRTPTIIMALVAEHNIVSGKRGAIRDYKSEDDPLEIPIAGIDDSYLIGVMPYGLAAKLLLDDNPRAASFYHQKYEELRDRYLLFSPASEDEEIVDLYGGIELGEFGHW